MFAMIKKYTTRNRSFKISPDGLLISVYFKGHFKGFIWNTSKIIYVDGDEVVSSDFFK